MDNKTLVERVAEFHKLMQKKDGRLAGKIYQAFIPLIQYKKPLEQASKEELKKISHVKGKLPDYLFRIFHGEAVEKVAENVPEYVRRTHPNFGKPIPTDHSDPDLGSWPDAVKRYEK
jgi:hypothetical protein